MKDSSPSSVSEARNEKERETGTSTILGKRRLRQVDDHSQILVSAEEGIRKPVEGIEGRRRAPSVLVDCKRRKFVSAFAFHRKELSKMVSLRAESI